MKTNLKVGEQYILNRGTVYAKISESIRKTYHVVFRPICIEIISVKTICDNFIRVEFSSVRDLMTSSNMSIDFYDETKISLPIELMTDSSLGAKRKVYEYGMLEKTIIPLTPEYHAELQKYKEDLLIQHNKNKETRERLEELSKESILKNKDYIEYDKEVTSFLENREE